MRIITGSAKGHRLVAPKGLATRPMQDRVKEALFSSLGPDVDDAAVIDLYAGSGSLGLEALSRGAASCVFVESGRHALDALSANIDSVGLGGRLEPVDVAVFLRAGRGGPYDLAFVDPPYDAELASVHAVLTGLCPLMKEDGIVILHRRKGEAAPEIPGLELTDDRVYGGAQIWRYRRTAS